MVHIETNALSGSGRQTLSMSRQAVPNSNHCIRLGTDRDGGVRKTLWWTARVRKERTLPDGLANGLYPTLCCPSRSVPVREENGEQAPAVNSTLPHIPTSPRYFPEPTAPTSSVIELGLVTAKFGRSLAQRWSEPRAPDCRTRSNSARSNAIVPRIGRYNRGRREAREIGLHQPRPADQCSRPGLIRVRVTPSTLPAEARPRDRRLR